MHVVFLDQFRAEFFLSGAFGRFIAHGGDELAGTEILFGIAVAIEAPAHLQAGLLIHQRHGVDAAMAGFAADALFDVDAVVEINVIGQVVHLSPADGFVSAVAFADGLEGGTVDPDLRMAVHAGLRGRDRGVLRIIDAGVAVAAIDTHGADVVRVAEGDGLFAGVALAGGVTGIGNEFEEKTAQAAEKDDGEHDARSGKGVRTGFK